MRTRSQSPSAMMGGGSSHFSGGVIVPLMNKTHYDFSYLSSSSETIVLASAIQVPFVTSAVLVCRVHVNELSAASGATFDVDCYPTAPSSEDPQEFSDATSDLNVQVTDSMSAPFYLDKSLSTPPKGAWWKVTLKATQPGTVTVAAQLSAFLVLRNG